MFTMLTYDNLIPAHRSDTGTARVMSPRETSNYVRDIRAYVESLSPAWMETHTRNCAAHTEHGYIEYTSYHLSFDTNYPGFDLTDIADIATRHNQDAIGVIFGSTLVGPGSDEYPTDVKPR